MNVTDREAIAADAIRKLEHVTPYRGNVRTVEGDGFDEVVVRLRAPVAGLPWSWVVTVGPLVATGSANDRILAQEAAVRAADRFWAERSDARIAQYR